MADRDVHLTDPEFVEIPVDRLLSKAHAAELAGLIDPRPRGACRRPRPCPRGGGTIYLATVDGDGNAVSLIESNYMGFGSGVVDPETGIHYQNRGSYFSLDPGPSERPRAGQADAPHAAARDAVPRRRAGAVGRDRARWAATPSPRSTPRSCRRSSTAGPTSRRRSPRRAGSSSRRRALRPAGRGPRRAAVRAGRPRGARGAGPPGHADDPVRRPARPRPRDRAGRRRPGRRRLARRRDRPEKRRACPPSGRESAPFRRDSFGVILGVTGGGLRSHDAATGFHLPEESARDLERRPELPLHERDRGRTRRPIAKLVGEREGLADTITAEATPLDDNERWWVWKCPTAGLPGLLHAAGYSREKHAVFVVCDGTCGKTFLR